MDNDHSQQQTEETSIEPDPSNVVHDGSSVFQSLWIRYRPVLADYANWEFIRSESRFVLISGTILWAIFILSLAI